MPALWLPLPLLTLLLMAPQVLETLYSPALTDISRTYAISAMTAGQTLTVYFFSFALGVFVWGRCSDHIGRRKSMLLGLTLYLCGAILALISQPHFSLLLSARIITAFGAAVGSVVTQIMLRDVLQGAALGKRFANMGVALSLSPMIGLACGGYLVQLGSVKAVFLGQLGLALLLLLWCLKSLPETQPHKGQAQTLPLNLVAKTMLKDPRIGYSVLLVTAFNVMVFAYFALAPFMFERLGWSQQQFGYSGMLLAIGSLMGAAINRLLLRYKMAVLHQLYVANGLALAAGILLLWRQHSLWLLLPATLTMVSFGLAIPNVLSQALTHYRHALGTAGALFGLAYYLSIALGLHLAILGQNLAVTLIISALLALSGTMGLGYTSRPLAK